MAVWFSSEKTLASSTLEVLRIVSMRLMAMSG